MRTRTTSTPHQQQQQQATHQEDASQGAAPKEGRARLAGTCRHLQVRDLRVRAMKGGACGVLRRGCMFRGRTFYGGISRHKAARLTDWTEKGHGGGHASKCPNVPWARHGSAEQPVSYSRRQEHALPRYYWIVLVRGQDDNPGLAANALVLPPGPGSWSQCLRSPGLCRCDWLDSGQKTGALIHQLRHILAMTHKMLPLDCAFSVGRSNGLGCRGD